MSRLVNRLSDRSGTSLVACHPSIARDRDRDRDRIHTTASAKSHSSFQCPSSSLNLSLRNARDSKGGYGHE